ncbi:MAG TPA: anthranilate synthase component I [Cellvibrio sp.]|nr:anthranilate synthase component I [Cellvibrio sp.]
MILDKAYETKSGVKVSRTSELVDYSSSVNELAEKLDDHLGCLLSSSYEYPNRYKRWDMGFVNPMVVISSLQNKMTIKALNKRGEVILHALAKALEPAEFIEELVSERDAIFISIYKTTERFAEEDRTRQPSVFSVLRNIVRECLFCEDEYFGLYGAFGYDLAFQFEQIDFTLERKPDQRDMVLFIPDSILIRDHERKEAYVHHYEFNVDGLSTKNLPREGTKKPYAPALEVEKEYDHQPGEYADIVRTAKKSFACGDLFEVVPGQTFFFPCKDSPSKVFIRLREANPSPYGFIMNLGQDEYLVGASPEMFVRVTKDLIETCPISGTIARGENAIADADQIKTLLNSEKDHNELTMCTDVDRNDKSRICVPGSIQVVGRRQIELYSKLIHTVDHVTGRLRSDLDALDAFLGHTWAVTVTGAPKLGAMKFLEAHEKSARRWYGGAVGKFGCNGDINTGLTLRTVRIAQGVAEVRVGATLLYDSVPEDEDEETRLKASALVKAIQGKHVNTDSVVFSVPKRGLNKQVLLIDHQDSFVHTLADYFRQTGATVTTLRCGFDSSELEIIKPDLVVLSPGPGRPNDFKLNETIANVMKFGAPIFGVCLGLQGIVEYFGGKLHTLAIPQHGRPSDISILESDAGIFKGISGDVMRVGRYHSLYAKTEEIPSGLIVTAKTADSVVMAIRHNSYPITAVQFHPESIMTFKNNAGLKLISNVYDLIPG